MLGVLSTDLESDSTSWPAGPPFWETQEGELSEEVLVQKDPLFGEYFDLYSAK